MTEPHVYQAIAEVVGPDFISDDPVVRQFIEGRALGPVAEGEDAA